MKDKPELIYDVGTDFKSILLCGYTISRMQEDTELLEFLNDETAKTDHPDSQYVHVYYEVLLPIDVKEYFAQLAKEGGLELLILAAVATASKGVSMFDIVSRIVDERDAHEEHIKDKTGSKIIEWLRS